LLGLPREPCLPALRGLLLPGDRLRDRPWTAEGRGGRAGRPQDPARLPAGEDLLGALDRRPLVPPRRRRLSQARAARRRAGDRGPDGLLALPQGEREPALRIIWPNELILVSTL